MPKRRALILDDEDDIVDIITSTIGSEYEIHHFKTIRDFLAFIESDSFESRDTFSFVDIVLDDDDQGGFKAISELNSMGIYMPTIFVSFSSQDSNIQRAAEVGAYAFLDKMSLLENPTRITAAIAQAEGAYIHRLKEKIGRLNEWGNRAIVLVGSLEHEVGNLTGPILNAALALKLLSDTQTSVPSNQVRKLCGHIISSADDVKTLLAHTFSFVKADAASLVSSNVDVVTLTRRIAERTTYRDIDLRLDFDCDTCFVALDEMKYTQIVANLLNNAIRHGGKTNIIVRLRSIGQTIDLSVRDFGPTELTQREIRRLWGPLERGEQAKTETGGGLGLTIIKYFAEMHGGASYHAYPQDGLKGNIFGVRLPKEMTV